MSTRYNVGDKVVIASAEVLRDALGINPRMFQYANTIQTIERIGDGFLPYRMAGLYNGSCSWCWSDDMIDHEATARLLTASPESESEPDSANEFSIDYYTDKIYNMFERYHNDGMLLDNADNYSKNGIRKNVEAWLKNKKKLFNVLRKHPNWNEEAKAVVYLNTEHRIPSCGDAGTAYDSLIQTCGYENIEPGVYPWGNIAEAFSDMSIETWQKLVDDSLINRFTFVSNCEINPRRLFSSIFYTIFKQEEMNVISEPIAHCINTFFPDLKIHAGAKSSRVMNKLFSKFGFDKTPSYNREFAKLADSMNPFDVERITVLSANIIDFLLMSNGNSWRSCHTILSGGPDNYGGCYMGGTLSYANDSESMILYTVDKDYHGTDYCFEPKINRQVFFWSYPVLVQERLYPQCNDGTEQGKALVKQYRTVVEDIMATCLETPNLWIKENRNRADVYRRDDTFMYGDWSAFPNYIVHLKKEIAVSENEVEEGGDTETCDLNYVIRSAKHIAVGGISYCINCGAEKCKDDFYDEENSHNSLLCHSCHPDEDTACCNECGCRDDCDNMHCIDGEWYCDECCFYCEYHQEYETGNYEYVENYGNVCEYGLADGDFYHCDECEEWYYDEPTTAVYDRYDYEIDVCDHCLERYYAQCDDCEEYFHNSNIFKLGSYYFCEDCYDKRMENEETEEPESSEEVTA